jgi:hypothetical protein
MSPKKPIDFNPVEAELEAAFHPIHPSTKFVQTIRHRIKARPSIEVSQRLASPSSVLFVLGGVLSVSLLIVTVVRAIFYLTNRAKF